MRRKKDAGPDAPAGNDGRISPVDVQQVEFRLAFRGYNERDVDAFLDKITEDLSAYIEENQRLRGGAPAEAPDGSTADAARLEAEQILSNARAEAEQIVRRAREQAAAVASATGANAGDARAAVTPFLNTEREFLQSLGSLVQTHAEDIKRMVLALRATRAQAPPAPMPDAPRQEAPPAPPASAASAEEIRSRLGEPSPPPVVRDEPDPLVVESATEPAFSTEGAPAGERGERSLRELFWGED